MHGRARASIQALVDAGNELWISRQVLREYAASMTRPAATGIAPLTRMQAADAVADFLTVFEIAEDGPTVTAHLVSLSRHVPLGGSQVHDANIVATTLAHGIERLLTFNLAHFRRFASLLQIVEPNVPAA